MSPISFLTKVHSLFYQLPPSLTIGLHISKSEQGEHSFQHY